MKFTKKETSILASQLAMLLSSGTGIYEAVNLISHGGEKEKNASDFYSLCLKGMDEGEPFSSCLKKSNMFDDYFVKMCAIGEKTGRLDEVMDSLSVYYEKSDYIDANVRSALRYPLIIVAVLFVVVGVIFVKVVPVFEGVYASLGSDIPSSVLIGAKIGSFLGKNYVWILLLLVLVAFLLYFYSKTPRGKSFFTRCSEKSVFTRNISEYSAVSKFSMALCVAIKSGLSVDESVVLAGELTDSTVIQEKVNNVQAYLEKGDSFALSLAKANLFESIYVGMVEVGVKSGMLDKMMDKIADEYTKDTDEAIEHSVAVIEPTLIIIICILVGTLLLSVMLPLISVMTAI